MSETPDTPNQADTPASPPRRKGPPWWGVAIFLVLVCGTVLVNQFATTSGPPVAWIEGDLDAALAQVSRDRPRVFLYLYEPNDPSHLRNERQVFTQRWARLPLKGAVCCRVSVDPREPDAPRTRARFAYERGPLFLLLTREGTPVSRTQGEVDEREFETYIGKPIEQAVKSAAAKDHGSDQP